MVWEKTCNMLRTPLTVNLNGVVEPGPGPGPGPGVKQEASLLESGIINSPTPWSSMDVPDAIYLTFAGRIDISFAGCIARI